MQRHENKSAGYGTVRSDHPDNINNEIIQAAGKAYLDAHGKANRNSCSKFFDSIFHSNHPAAFKLKSYNENSDAYAKWHFLAECYAGLVKSKGELSTAILNLFTPAFGRTINTYKLVHATETLNDFYMFDDNDLSPQEICDALKITIDSHYIREYRREAKRITDNIQPVQNSLAMIKGDPESLADRTIQNIGRYYLEKHPQESRSCRLNFMDGLLHQNQGIASKLTNFKSDSDAYDKWMSLASAYSELYGSKGELSNAILNVFLIAFGKSVYTHEMRYRSGRFGGYFYSVYYSPEHISDALKGMVNEYYANQYRNQLGLNHKESKEIIPAGSLVIIKPY